MTAGEAPAPVKTEFQLDEESTYGLSKTSLRAIKNRESQRKFRQRRKQHVMNIEQELQNAKASSQEYKTALDETQAELRDLQYKYEQLQKDYEVALQNGQNGNGSRSGKGAVGSQSGSSGKRGEAEKEKQAIRISELMSSLEEMTLDNSSKDVDLVKATRELAVLNMENHSLSLEELAEIVSPTMQAKFSILDASVGSSSSAASKRGSNSQPVLSGMDSLLLGHVSSLFEEPQESEVEDTTSGLLCQLNDASTWMGLLEELRASPDQIKKLQAIRSSHVEALIPLHVERSRLNTAIRSFFADDLASFRQFHVSACNVCDASTVLDITSKLTKLKTNLSMEQEIIKESQDKIFDVLTPKQGALMMLKAFGARMGTRALLQSVWQAMSGSEEAAGAK